MFVLKVVHWVNRNYALANIKILLTCLEHAIDYRMCGSETGGKNESINIRHLGINRLPSATEARPNAL